MGWGDIEAFGVGMGGCNSGVAALDAPGATLLLVLRTTGFCTLSSWSAVEVTVCAVWSGSNTSLGSMLELGAMLLFLGRPRRGFGVAGSGVGSCIAVLRRVAVVRRAGAGVKSSSSSSSTFTGASAISSSEVSTMAAVRRVVRRVDCRVAMVSVLIKQITRSRKRKLKE